MRKKIKELMNREEGFTLVELLAVIVILGIILAIAIPSIGNVISNARENAKGSEEALVVDAARLYFVNAETSSTVEYGLAQTVTVGILKSEGYLDVRDSKTLNDDAELVTRTDKGVITFREYSTAGG